MDNNLSTSSSAATNKQRKIRRAAGRPDPDAEVVYLSPTTLLESIRYVCEICNKGFKRDQNLQMHRRRHNELPRKPLKKEKPPPAVRKRVYVCPEPSCKYHDTCRALGSLGGIKKHYKRQHSNQRPWVCERCSKAYALPSDLKTHLKKCGTSGHSCNCGRVFSRVKRFIKHQEECIGRLGAPEPPGVEAPVACSSRTEPNLDLYLSTT